MHKTIKIDITPCGNPIDLDELDSALQKMSPGIRMRVVDSDFDKKTETPEQRMWRIMQAVNGQILIKAGRYGGGWLALGTATSEYDLESLWDDLTGGDNDYFEARDSLKANTLYTFIEHAPSAQTAFARCVVGMIKQVDGSLGPIQ